MSEVAEVDVNLWSEAAHATDYIERRRTIPHREEGYAALLEFLPDGVGRVADLGTGDGYLLDDLRRTRPGIGGVAVDFSDEMLRRARERFAAVPEVTVLEHDLDVPLPDWEPFDAVVSAFAIHHVADVRKRALYAEVHEGFLSAIGSSPEGDDPSNKLAPVEDQLAWLREAGFGQVDCHWKWRELALLGAVRSG
jgi:SAM-dependent methyltransferase